MPVWNGRRVAVAVGVGCVLALWVAAGAPGQQRAAEGPGAPNPPPNPQAAPLPDPLADLAAPGGGAGLGRQAREGGDYKVKLDNPMLATYPELKTAPAPKWVRPGIRLTVYSASATVSGSRDFMPVLDANGGLSDKWGNKYRMDAAASSSGHGYTQLDVLALHRDAVVVNLTMYVLMGEKGPATMVSASGLVLPPGSVYDWWSNPDVMGQHLDAAGPGVKVGRVPYEAAGRKFEGFWVSTTADRSSTCFVVDLQGGIILHAASALYDPTQTVTIDGRPHSVGGRTDMAQTTLVSVRALKLPWAGGELPEAAAKATRLVYEGVHTLNISGMTMQTRHVADSRVVGRGSDFLQVRTQSVDETVPGMPPQTAVADGVMGVNELVPIFMAPQRLAELKPGQVIDRDPLTKVSVVVSSVDAARVVLSQVNEGNGLRSDCTFDRRSGWMTAIVSFDPNPLKMTRAEMKLTRVE